MRRFFLILLALACLIFPAYAEDTQTVDASTATSVTTAANYLRVTCPLDGEQSVMVTVTDARGNPQYQRDYGACSGTFRSEDIFLRLDGAKTTYNVTVQAGQRSYGFTVDRVMPRMTGNAACSAGYPLSMLNGSGNWQSVTILDVAALEGTSMTVPMHASGAYTLGTVTFSVTGGQLNVSAEITSGVDGSIDGSTVYVATNAVQAQQLAGRNFSGLTGKLQENIDLGGTPYAAVLVQLTVSFDPTGVSGSPDALQFGQDQLWLMMQQTTANEAVG